MFYFLLSCDFEDSNRENKENIYTFHENPLVKGEIMFHNQVPKMQIGYDSLGNISNIRLFNEEKLVDEILFFDNGKLKVKTSLKDSTLIRDGDTYHFFSTGRLKSDWTWENDILKGEARKYHESNGRLKQYMIYSTKGNLMYRKTFNDKGELISVEGEKP